MDPTTGQPSTIELAYRAVTFVPSQEGFRRGHRKKTYNPAQTAPTLNRVITHLEGDIDFPWAKRQAKRILLMPEASRYVDTLQSPEALRDFLATLSLFLKTTATRGKRAMQPFEDQGNQVLGDAEAVATAWSIVNDIPWHARFNRNKLIRLAGRIQAVPASSDAQASAKWECLAVLAQYYPLKGVPQPLIDRLVKELGRLDVASFQAVVSQVLIFYRASAVKPEEQAL